MGIRFKIANFIMNDYLRNYLAVGVKLPIENLIKYKYQYSINDFEIHKLEQIVQTIDELFNM